MDDILFKVKLTEKFQIVNYEKIINCKLFKNLTQVLILNYLLIIKLKNILKNNKINLLKI